MWNSVVEIGRILVRIVKESTRSTDNGWQWMRAINAINVQYHAVNVAQNKTRPSLNLFIMKHPTKN